MSGSPERAEASPEVPEQGGQDSAHSATTNDVDHELTSVEHADADTPSLPPRPAAEPGSAPTTLPPSDHVSNPPASLQDEHESPQVVALRGLFPDFDTALLQSVLESVGYNQEQAIDILLGMSDPDYVATTAPAAPEHDLALDEQLARQLALEDEQQAHHATGQSWPRRGDAPYEARRNAPTHPQQQEQQYVTGSERGDFQDFQETLGRMAESGKRTFSSIVSKAKAKINEYNQQRPSQPSTAPTNPQWGSAPPTQLDRHTASQAYAQQYYGYDSGHPDPSTGDVRSVPPAARNQEKSPFEHDQEHVSGYDVDAASASKSPTTVPALPPMNAVAPSSPSATSRPSMSSRPSSDTPRPPPTGSGSPINAAKFGLLPKKPVSLLNTAQVQRPRDDEDELEYVENPFEEGHD